MQSAAHFVLPQLRQCFTTASPKAAITDSEAAGLGRSIGDAFHSCVFGAMGATINLTTSLNAMTDHCALAVRTTRRHCVNCTFEAVECHGLSGLRDLERLVVVVAADITNSHETLPVSKPTLRAHACSWPLAAKKARRAVRPPEPCARTVTAGFMGSDD
jgi:hypothetical protein